MTTSANEKYKCPNGIHHMKTNGIKCVICGEITRTPVNDRHKDNDCDYGKVIEGFHTDDCTCPTPAKEWREEFDEMFAHSDECTTLRIEEFEDNCYCKMKDIKSFIQNLLTAHSAHLVERNTQVLKNVLHILNEGFPMTAIKAIEQEIEAVESI